MKNLSSLAVITFLVTASNASYNPDKCHRGVFRNKTSSATIFYRSSFNTTSTSTPSGIAASGTSRIPSAYGCLPNADPTKPSATPTSVTMSSTTFNPSTCPRNSIAACPTPFDPCCAYICAEAQVPFKVCSPENETVLAQCSKCPSPVSTSSILSMTNLNTGLKITPTQSTLTTSTCSGRLLSTTACPTPYDPCCAWNCEEAQVLYNVRSQTDGSGEFAVCTQCPTPTV